MSIHRLSPNEIELYKKARQDFIDRTKMMTYTPFKIIIEPKKEKSLEEKSRSKVRLKGGIANLISQNIEQIERRPISKERRDQLVSDYVRRLSPEFKEVYEEMQQELYESESK